MVVAPPITEYIKLVESGKEKANNDRKKLIKLIKKILKKEKLIFNQELYEKYLAIGKAMYKQIFPWQTFLLALFLCLFKADGKPRFPKGLVLIGRGAGKDGFIAWISLCLITRHNEVKNYDVDICANNEEQAIRPVKDVVDFLNRPEYFKKNQKSFYWTMERVRGKVNKGYIKGHTNNPKGRDGLRSGAVILNEIHEYKDYKNIDVFTTGLGKKAHPRMYFFTTNGDVRDGALDYFINYSEQILNEEIPDDGFLPFICRLNTKDEVHDKEKWAYANPSLPFIDSLMDEMEGEYKVWVNNPAQLTGFMAKRMNLPDSVNETAVVNYEYIKATNKPLKDLAGKTCIIGIDGAKVNDFIGVSAVFLDEGKYYVLHHTFICNASADLPRIKIKSQFPQLQEKGEITLIDGPQHDIDAVIEYVNQLRRKYIVDKICIDDYKYSIFATKLMEIGYSKERKNLKLVRPQDIAKAFPYIEMCFLSEKFIWGDCLMLRWATNNTKVVNWKTKSINNEDMGNRIYGKIEGKSRKTDPFMSLVHAMTCHGELKESVPIPKNILKVRVFS